MESFDKGLKLGYGCYGLSGAYGKKLSKKEKINLLNTAYDMGIRYFDTASIYGDSDEILGIALENRRENIIISTKAGVQNNRIKISGKELVKACESSLRRLKTDYIDIFHIHYGSKDNNIDETIEGLESLKQKGYIRAYGIGHMNNEDIDKYLEKGNIFSILMEMNIINNEKYNYLVSVMDNKYINSRAREVKFIPFSITARGLLTGVINKNTRFNDYDIRSIDPLFNKERMYRIAKVIENLEKLAKELGCSVAQLAISWVINKEGVWKALMGPTNIEHLTENIKALDVIQEKKVMDNIDKLIESFNHSRDEETLKWIKKILEEQPSEYVLQEIKNLIHIIDFSIDKGIFSGDLGLQLFTELINIKNNRFNRDNTILKLREIKEEIKMSLEYY